MLEGIELDQGVMIQVLQNKLAQITLREAQLEAAVQSQSQEIQVLRGQLQALSEGEADDASAN